LKAGSQPKNNEEVKDVEKLRTPLMVQAVYLALLCISTLSPSLALRIFGPPEVKDVGVLLTLSGLFLGFAVVVWTVASNIEKYGGLSSTFVIALLISAVFLAYAWATKSLPARTALVPLIINLALAYWVWSARPKA
jgi:hypothetical protein